MAETVYQKVDEDLIRQFREIVDSKHVITNREELIDYSHDEYVGEEIHSYPEIVVKPKTTEEVSQIVRLCHAERIPLTGRPVTPHAGGAAA